MKKVLLRNIEHSQLVEEQAQYELRFAQMQQELDALLAEDQRSIEKLKKVSTFSSFYHDRIKRRRLMASSFDPFMITEGRTFYTK